MRAIFLMVVTAGVVFAFTRSNTYVVHYESPPRAPRSPVDVAQTAASAPVVVKKTSRTTRPPKPAKPRADETRVVWRTNIDGGARTTSDEAWIAALDKATRTIEDQFDLQQSLDAEEIATRLVVNDETKTIDAGESGQLQSVSLSLEMTAEYAGELARRERSISVSSRMSYLTRIIAVLVAGLAAIAGYVRLDDWSKGYFSGALKFAAAAAAVGIAFAAFRIR